MKPRTTLAALFILTLLTTVYLTTAPRREIGLKRFYEITKADPLFYDARLDTGSLDEALKKLDNSELNLENANGYYAKLLATKHLGFLSDIKSATEVFLNNRSFLSAERLTRLQKAFVSAYKNQAQAHKIALERIASKRGKKFWSQRIAFFGGATTAGIVKDDLGLIIKNAETLEGEISRREKCLWYAECDFSPIGLESQLKPDVVVTNQEKPPTDRLLPPDLLAPGRYDAFRGPYYTKTGCFGFEENGAPKLQAFYLFEKKSKILFLED